MASPLPLPPSSVLHLLLSSQSTGRFFTRGTRHLPPSFRAILDKRNRGMLQLLTDLSAFAAQRAPVTARDCTSASTLLHQLGERIADANGGRGGALAPEHRQRDRAAFGWMGGARVLVALMYRFEEELNPPTKEAGGIGGGERRGGASGGVYGGVGSGFAERRRQRAEQKAREGAMNAAMAVLREHIFASATPPEGACMHAPFIHFLFRKMACAPLFDNAVCLAEEILALREQPFDLGCVTGFHGLIRGFSTRQLAFFCRVLALVVFEVRPSAWALVCVCVCVCVS